MKILALLGTGIAILAASTSFANHFDLQVSRCFRVENGEKKVTCSGLVRNTSATSKDNLITPMFFRRYSVTGELKGITRMYSYDGEVYDASDIVFGADETSALKEWAQHRVQGTLPVKFSVSFKNVPETIKSIGRIDIFVRPDEGLDTKVVSVEDIAID